MKKQINYIFLLIITLIFSGCITNNFNYSNANQSQDSQMIISKGTFTVSMSPVEGSHTLKLEKQYTGALVANGFGEMLATRSTSVEGSASYVAIEAVTGSLDGKRGSFTLVHRGVMSGDHKELQVNISPDSGTEELLGISGSLEIIIEEGKHYYVLEYTFADE